MRPSQGRGCFRTLPDVGYARLEAGELAAVGVLEVSDDGPAPFPEDFAEVHGEVVVDDWPLTDGNLVRTEEESHVRGEVEANFRFACFVLSLLLRTRPRGSTVKVFLSISLFSGPTSGSARISVRKRR